jgi:fatty acid desaturase
MVFVVMIQWTLFVAWALNFERLEFLYNTLTFLGMLFLGYYNPIVITHNFLHTPFFESSRLNRLFSLFNTMNMGLPQIIYKYHHLNHHRYNNSLEDPSSTFLYGKNNQQEYWIWYSALSFFRDGTQKAWKIAVEKGESNILYSELAMALAFWSFFCLVSWKFFVFAYIPFYLCQWFLAHVENYYEHFKASNPTSRYANSVSFYPRWYNLFMFNEGYHQEHHISPQEHWTKRPDVRERYKEQMNTAGAYQAKLPPLLGMLE